MRKQQKTLANLTRLLLNFGLDQKNKKQNKKKITKAAQNNTKKRQRF